MIVRDHGPGGRWYVAAVHYPSALMAKRAFERVERKLGRLGNIGVLRLTPRIDGGPEIPSGAPEGVHPVVAVTLEQSEAHKCKRILSDGTPWVPLDGFADALIARRARVVLDHPNGGRLVIRRPEGRGARLEPDGQIYEPTPRQG